MNKSVHLPSLDHQLTGPLLQYKHTWNQKKKDVDGCPCCFHVSIMAVKLQVEVNTKISKIRAKLSAGGGDGKLVIVSAIHGCYCLLNNCRNHWGGYDCLVCIKIVCTQIEERESGERQIIFFFKCTCYFKNFGVGQMKTERSHFNLAF
jgi:hypothetical protein